MKVRSYNGIVRTSPLLDRLKGRPIHSSNAIKKQSKLILKELDKKWVNRWKNDSQSDLNKTAASKLVEGKPDFYCLSMFPYPSGMLHMGHLRVYTISDVISRFKKLNGYNVIHPMGWDSFGLPAENAAVERGINPATWTNSNIEKMKEQMELMLADFDWDRELSTCSETYYKWTQKIFLLLYKHGLAYRKNAEINWDPVDMTVLANEQVDSEGRSWRSGAVVEKKQLEQWFIKITDFADDLDNDLKVLDQWPEKVKSMQRNWIGKSKGAEIKFPTTSKSFSHITVFTSRPETLFSVQFLALSLDHPIVKEAASKDEKLRDFRNLSDTFENDSKEGYLIKDLKVSIPIDVNNGKRQDFKIPVYVAPYVLSSYGHGAVMGCPGHDDRDFEFWKIHSPNVEVIKTVGRLPQGTQNCNDSTPYTDKNGNLFDNSTIPGGLNDLGIYNRKSIASASQSIISALESHNLGKQVVKYRLRDWLISRQRYWGAPIPVVHCEECGTVPVTEEDLPVQLPSIEGSIFGKGNPLSDLEEFVNVECPSCGGNAKRDTDTMDTFMDSSWYFFRFLDSKNTTDIFSSEKINKNMPVDLYIGGVEHAILHLLYSRFISKFLGSIGLWSNDDLKNEPIKRLVTQGMVHGKTLKDPESGRFLKPEELYVDENNTLRIKKSSSTPIITFEKMSKSKYNGADPAECIKKYGADATRALMLFSAPISDVLNWNEEQIHGICRWLNKVYDLSNMIVDYKEQTNRIRGTSSEKFTNITIGSNVIPEVYFNKVEEKLYSDTQKYISDISKSIEVDLSFNTIISDYMKLTNSITSALKSNSFINQDLLIDSYKKLLILMAPVTPCVAEECWENFSYRQNFEWKSIFNESFPKARLLEKSNISYKTILNGKPIYTFSASKDLVHSGVESIKEKLMDITEVREKIEGKTISKVIAKPGVISIVLNRH